MAHSYEEDIDRVPPGWALARIVDGVPVSFALGRRVLPQPRLLPNAGCKQGTVRARTRGHPHGPRSGEERRADHRSPRLIGDLRGKPRSGMVIAANAGPGPLREAWAKAPEGARPHRPPRQSREIALAVPPLTLPRSPRRDLRLGLSSRTAPLWSAFARMTAARRASQYGLPCGPAVGTWNTLSTRSCTTRNSSMLFSPFSQCSSHTTTHQRGGRFIAPYGRQSQLARPHDGVATARWTREQVLDRSEMRQNVTARAVAEPGRWQGPSPCRTNSRGEPGQRASHARCDRKGSHKQRNRARLSNLVERQKAQYNVGGAARQGVAQEM